MPGPPPPPPMAPAAPPPPVFKAPSVDGSNERGALLKAIQKGTKLKKTVTNDKSGPMIPGTTRNGSINNNNNSINSNIISPVKSHTSIQMELKKQLANDTRNRGPPPPAPNRVTPAESNGFRQNPIINGINLSQINLKPVNLSSPRGRAGTPSTTAIPNTSTLHRKAKSNANLSCIETQDEGTNSSMATFKSSFNSGKPNLAPKPPVLNGKPISVNQQKFNKSVTRTHSLKSPRSPSPESNNDGNPKFGTVRHMSTLLGRSLANTSGHTSRSRPSLNISRPSAPPPSVPQQIPSLPSQQAPPPPPSKLMAPIRHPNQAPPPPPTLIPHAPNHAPPPPPPPHKALPAPPHSPAATYKQHTISNNISNSHPPPPPPRHSSMQSAKVSADLEEKYKDSFQSPVKFPNPPHFRKVLKIYNSKQGQLKPPGYIV